MSENDPFGVLLTAADMIERLDARNQRLRIALLKLLEADRGFLGSDHMCVYCEKAQHIEGHAPDCVITKAFEALS